MSDECKKMCYAYETADFIKQLQERRKAREKAELKRRQAQWDWEDRSGMTEDAIELWRERKREREEEGYE